VVEFITVIFHEYLNVQWHSYCGLQYVTETVLTGIWLHIFRGNILPSSAVR